ncbi:MAG: broad-specificity cellobiase [Frankiales bacterium]|nr:broad-specificity cellobiase [Frankiales bacterium]
MGPLRHGVATSAYQIEGAVDVDGRGPSVWDTFCARPGTVLDGSDGSTACDSYRRQDEDLALLVDLGVSSYRFSVAWPRVQPTGSGPANPAGLDHYERLVDALLARGLQPLPTLYHWDLPQALEDAGGWPVRDTALRFADYAGLVADRLADRVTDWSTHNEPWCTAFLGYASGVFAPGRREPEAAYLTAHHLLLSHALGAEQVRARSASARVGIVLNLTAVRGEEGADPAAVDVVDAVQNRLWLQALSDGTYPEVLTHLAGHEDDLAGVRGSADWVGVNYYTPFRVGPGTGGPVDAVGQDVDAFPGAPPFAFAPRPPLTDMGWEVDATGLEEVLLRVAADLPGVPLRVTENGASFPDDHRDDDGAVVDEDRVSYLRDHLAAVDRARAAGVPVTDYVAWSLLDNFEWAQGYTQTFGLVSVEPGTLRRVPKASFRWYAEHVRAAGG